VRFWIGARKWKKFVREREREREMGHGSLKRFFNCPICLELVYKPVVKECGHLFCFWCVYKSMNRTTVSHCPLCQKPYVHLPRICDQLHRLLQRIEPEEYARRSSEVAQEEGEEEEEEEEEEDHITSRSTSSELLLQCKACSEVVYKPIVLNCGHLFCKTCVSPQAEASSKIKCPTCGAHHPGLFPQTCLELHHYLLETHCAGEYTKRAANKLLLKQKQRSGYAEVEEGSHEEESAHVQQQQNLLLRLQQWGESEADHLMLHNTIHRGVGCDGCGMMPILGKRFSCSDCDDRESNIGYDLCGSCHDDCHQGINFPAGRFNQKHSPQHRMVEKGSTKPWILLWSWS
jgi:hypothetical protein